MTTPQTTSGFTDDFVIEIDHNDIIKWLDSRKKLSKGWQNRLEALRIKTERTLEEIRANSPEEIKKLLASPQEEWSFETLKEVLEALKSSSEGESKTFFGG